MGFPGGSAGKEPACNAGDLVPTLGWEDTLEQRKVTHSSILAWRIFHGLYIVHGVAKSWTQLNSFLFSDSLSARLVAKTEGFFKFFLFFFFKNLFVFYIYLLGLDWGIWWRTWTV